MQIIKFSWQNNEPFFITDEGNIKLREASPDSSADDLFYIEYERKPLDGAAYAQTTLSMGEIVLNAGVRFDFYWTNGLTLI
jgi:hypothetical protein